ncbi:hypothetical protein [Winogradskya humida]|uniref:Uncharacterized protein n=1 Tax=Winogradskya humida TaxID=113566 RepID=A0ABQ4A7H6_9ACTN|nr:hypothetical protein [Actinoplanes humidus]GIE26664.1 hypothetical protein Ahu01nite_097660 [Actinoplanes humidus]
MLIQPLRAQSSISDLILIDSGPEGYSSDALAQILRGAFAMESPAV